MKITIFKTDKEHDAYTYKSCAHEYIIRPDSRAKKCKKCPLIKIEN